MLVSRRILLMFAHPDDESFGAAGLSRRYADAGAEIALLTATRGDAGKVGDPPLCSREELPACREAELRKAAAILGIGHVHVLDYHDKHLAEAPPDKVRTELVGFIRFHRPQIVITFDPNGANAHVDHIAIARFAMDAVAAAADARWHKAQGPAHHVQRVLWTSPMLPWDAARSPDLTQEPGIDFLLDVSVHRKAKAAALRAHRTQHASIDRHFFNRPDVDRMLSIETFRQAWGPQLRNVPEEDIFAGVLFEDSRWTITDGRR
jgi:N-acetylglucosamine malate deacetylase 2